MNIEQIAKEARLSMLRDFNGLSEDINICVKDDTEFLRRCLEKLAEQVDAEPVGYLNPTTCAVIHNSRKWADRGNEFTAKLYTETQLIAAQLQVAKACVNLCKNLQQQDGDGQHPQWYTGFDICINNISSNEWMKYL